MEEYLIEPCGLPAPKRKIAKNCLRALVVVATCVTAIYAGKALDHFVSLIGTVGGGIKQGRFWLLIFGFLGWWPSSDSPPHPPIYPPIHPPHTQIGSIPLGLIVPTLAHLWIFWPETPNRTRALHALLATVGFVCMILSGSITISTW